MVTTGFASRYRLQPIGVRLRSLQPLLSLQQLTKPTDYLTQAAKKTIINYMKIVIPQITSFFYPAEESIFPVVAINRNKKLNIMCVCISVFCVCF